MDLQDFVSDLTVGAEINVGILPAGRTDVIQLDLLQCSLAARRLLGLGSVGGESLDEFLQFLDLLFLLLVRFLHLTDHQLG